MESINNNGGQSAERPDGVRTTGSPAPFHKNFALCCLGRWIEDDIHGSGMQSVPLIVKCSIWGAETSWHYAKAFGLSETEIESRSLRLL